MKNLLLSLSFGLIMLGLVFSCNKDSNNYSIADYTLGMLKSRTWHGHADGYAKGTKVVAGETVEWPVAYSRTIDTTFALLKVNAFVLDAPGARIKFFSIDSTVGQKTFDSTYAHSARTFLVYNWVKDSMYFECHKVGDHNAAAGRAYEDNMVLISDM